VSVSVYILALSRTPWLYSDVRTHTKQTLSYSRLFSRSESLSDREDTLEKARPIPFFRTHTYTQTPLLCHPCISPSLSLADLSLIEELRMRCTNIFHLYCHLQREAGGGRGGESCVCVLVRERERERKDNSNIPFTIVCHLHTETEADEDIGVHKICVAD
jgi:hypothetical protein